MTRFGTSILAAGIAGLAALAPLAADTVVDKEVSQGNDMYKTAVREGYIVTQGAPDAADVSAISAKLFPSLQKSYGAPFTVAFVQAAAGEPADAYTLIGPRIYIDTSFPAFIKNREALAGVMCHEANHVLHHDALHSMRASGGKPVSASLAQHTRAEEERADLDGADTCAAAGLNPWGLVWALQAFQAAYGNSSGPPIVADHPSVAVRIKRLTEHLTSNPKAFGSFSQDPTTATPL